MQHRDAYPYDTVTGACFITGDYDVSEGCVDLDTYLDVLPAFGRLCLSPSAVRQLVTTMGWHLADDEAVAVLHQEVEDVRTENMRLRRAIAEIFNARTLSAVDRWAEEFA